MNDLESLLRETLNSTAAIASPITGPSLRRLSRKRQRRVRAGGGTLVAVTAVAVAAGAPRILTADRSGPSDGLSSASPSVSYKDADGNTAPFVVGLPPRGRRDPKAEPASLPDCDGSYGPGYSRDVPPTQLTSRLLGSDSYYPLDKVEATEFVSDCVWTPAALTLTSVGSDGTIERAVTVWGPRRTPMSYASFSMPATKTTVRGVAAQAVEIGFPTSNRIAWTESPGSSWEITGLGLTQRELESIAGQLAINGGSATLPEVPAGYEVDVRTSQPPLAANQKEWTATYAAPPGWLELKTTERPKLLAESVSLSGDLESFRFMEVRGRQALARSSSGQLVEMIWQEQPGVQASLNSWDVRIDENALAKFAGSLGRVDADDPRIAAKLLSDLYGTRPHPPTPYSTAASSSPSATP